MTPEEFFEKYGITVVEVASRVRAHCSRVLHPGADEAFYFLGRPSVTQFAEELGVDEAGFGAIGLLDLIRAAGETWDRIDSGELDLAVLALRASVAGEKDEASLEHYRNMSVEEILEHYGNFVIFRKCILTDTPACPNGFDATRCVELCRHTFDRSRPAGRRSPQDEAPVSDERRLELDTLTGAVGSVASSAIDDDSLARMVYLWRRRSAEHTAIYLHLLDAREEPDQE